MPNLAGMLWLESTSSLAICSLPSYSLAISSRIGAIALQGPHHSAQKSTRTGLSDFNTSASKEASEICLIFSLMVFLDLRDIYKWSNSAVGIVRVLGVCHQRFLKCLSALLLIAQGRWSRCALIQVVLKCG